MPDDIRPPQSLEDVRGLPFARPSPTSSPEWLLLLIVTLLAGVIRTLHLTARGFNFDEGFSVYLAQTSAANFKGLVWHSELNMALYYGVLRLWIVLGHSEFVLRMLGVLLATATVPVVYFLGKRLFDARTGLIAALLLAFHPSHFILAQSARSYSLAILMVCLASLFFLRGLQSPTWANWIGYSLFAAAAVYSHFFATLVIAAHAVSLLFLRRGVVRWKWLLTAASLMAVLLLPVLTFLLRRRDAANVAWVSPLSFDQAKYVFYSLTLSKSRSLTYVAAWALAAWYTLRRRATQSAWPFWFIACWLLIPPLIAVAISWLQPVLVERYLAVCIPAAALLAADGIAFLAQGRRVIALCLLVLTLIYSASGIRFYARHPEFGESWREATAYVMAQAHPGDEVVVMEGLPSLTFDYYRQNSTIRVPDVLIANSAAAPLPSPPPADVWFIGTNLLQPTWEQEAHRFLELHVNEYCSLTTQPQPGTIQVWHFRRCAPEATAIGVPPRAF
jgi:mannosyltransferase